MCGISGVLSLNNEPISALDTKLKVFNSIQQHRGPDATGVWNNVKRTVGFAHQRLSIIDLETGDQPMRDDSGNVICYNGEIYNYIELRNELKSNYTFKTQSDTEVILAAYQKWGKECLNRLRGMFAFAIWDEKNQELFCARDRFGIKPFYYAINDTDFYFASEAKSLIPFVKEVKTNQEALQDYFIFQLMLGGKTLFEGVNELLRSHYIIIKGGSIKKKCYWEVYYDLDWKHTAKYFEEKLFSLIEESIQLHLRSDVPVGAYVSGGIDSGIIASLASRKVAEPTNCFLGKFEYGELYDESRYAKALASENNIKLFELPITANDFIANIEKVIYHLDFPVAGPGSFPQFMVSKLAGQHNKVVLGGQGGDEIFGGYTRYLIAYFEQCIKGAIDGTLNNGNFVVSYESIIPNLESLKNYKPLLKQFWCQGLFEDIDKRYFHLINRAPTLKDEIRWEDFLVSYNPFESFQKIFNGSNVGKESYFDKMTHFDFKTLLPGLLHVEDRMSMAHGVESRVPFLDHQIVEFASTIPADIKFKDGKLKKILLNSMKDVLPMEIINRKDKMGFPVPINEWFKNELKTFIFDTFNSTRFKNRPFINSANVLKGLNEDNKFGRKIWGLLSLELWFQQFHDKKQ